MPERSDTELVERARQGDVDSLGELYRRHYATAVGIAYSALADRHLAEDAAQEAFAIVCRDLGRLYHADKFASWLGAICRNVASKAAKSRRRYRFAENVESTFIGDQDDDRNSLVRQSVERLSRSAREVIVLHYFSGLSHEQIAEALGISPQAVHGRLIRGRRKIEDDLRRNGLGGRKQ